MKEITERTTISIAVVISLIGGVMGISKIYFMADAAATSIERVSQKQEKYSDDIAEIKKDIAVIKNIVEEKGK